MGAAAAPAAVTGHEATGLKYVPRAPQRRGEVTSWTPAHLRERVAFLRCWWHDHYRTRIASYAATTTLTVEHWRHTFPAIIGFVTGLLHVLAWLPHLVGFHTGHPAGH